MTTKVSTPYRTSVRSFSAWTHKRVDVADASEPHREAPNSDVSNDRQVWRVERLPARPREIKTVKVGDDPAVLISFPLAA